MQGEKMANTLCLTAFGKNDIRGIYGEDVTEELFYGVGRAFVKYLKENTGLNPTEMWIAIGEDTRLHSQSLTDSLIKGVNSAGANVVDLGMVPTPLTYYAEAVGINKEITMNNKITASLMVTASHNPKEYNGLKLTFNKTTLNEAEIKKLKNILISQSYEDEQTNRYGLRRKYDLIPDYIEKMVNNFAQIGKNVKVVVDSANATGGVVGPRLYKELGAEVIELFAEPDGNFPNHHPNPSVESTLDSLKAKVIEEKADLGIAFDGDADRIGVVDSKGNYLTGDKLLLIYAMDVIKDLIKRQETPVVVSEVKCSQVLYDTINNAGAKAIMTKTGHGYIKSKMKEENAILAGEMSGHTFFKDRYYGFDDAIYAGCRIIEIIAKNKMKNPDFKIENLLGAFDKVYSSKEFRYSCPNNLKKPILEKLTNKINENKNIFQSEIKDIITIDGLRIIFEGGFALIRQSNTEPVFTLRFEAQNQKQ